MKHPCVQLFLGPSSAQLRAFWERPLEKREKKKKKKGQTEGQTEGPLSDPPCHKGTAIVQVQFQVHVARSELSLSRIIVDPAILFWVPLSLPPAWFGLVSVGICQWPCCSVLLLSDSLHGLAPPGCFCHLWPFPSLIHVLWLSVLCY